ncbi:HTH-type transcriptional regulator DmlR [Pseudomonas fluorescens]|uniref:LysR family transcriptional regulator n=1 Tax=Pseudomonas fluorescens TaxID=294 RepID=UPI0012568FC8|nr:LysR family transcriptional regulator [Pseudomonas fluorescens]CAG8865772.1 HTH-type transcriptional regulator DmlR [Pseudomonas fluorescens]VVP88282.1 HTH-type transcriptional regulator DmlR [Pseudomonas fluorescens]
MITSETLKGIHVFVCVANVGSFSAAARRLNLTNSAVSKGIARLEQRLELRLFNRTTRRLSLTDAGAQYYRTCSEVLGCLEEAEQTLRDQDAEPRGRVRLELPASYGRVHVLPLLLEFLRGHPQLLPHITFSDRFVDPVEQGIDIVVRIGAPDAWPALLGHQYLGAQRLVFCAAPAYLEARGTPATADDLDAHDCILYGHEDGAVTPWYFSSQPGHVDRRLMQGRIAIGDGESQLMAAVAGAGITQLPTWLVNRYLATGELVEVLPQLAMDSLPLNLVWLKSRQSLPKVRALLQVLGACLTPSGRVDQPSVFPAL